MSTAARGGCAAARIDSLFRPRSCPISVAITPFLGSRYHSRFGPCRAPNVCGALVGQNPMLFGIFYGNSEFQKHYFPRRSLETLYCNRTAGHTILPDLPGAHGLGRAASGRRRTPRRTRTRRPRARGRRRSRLSAWGRRAGGRRAEGVDVRLRRVLDPYSLSRPLPCTK